MRAEIILQKRKASWGIDIRGASGDPIHAIQDGKVVISPSDVFRGDIHCYRSRFKKIFSLYASI